MTPDQGDTPRKPPEQQPQRQHQPTGGGGQPPAGAQPGPAGPGVGGPQGGQQPPRGGQQPPQGPQQQPPTQPPRQSEQAGRPQQPPAGAQPVQPQSRPQQPQPQGPGQTMQGPQQSPQSGPGGMQPSMGGSQLQQPTGGQGTRGVGGQIQGARATMGEQRFLEPMSVDDVVQTDVYTAERDTSVATIVSDMRDHQVGSVVVTEDETPIGILTDRSIAMALPDHDDILEATADDLTEGEVVSAMEGTDLFEVLDTMREEGIRRVPIVDEEGKLEGIISVDDILVLLEQKLSTVTETIRQQFPNL